MSNEFEENMALVVDIYNKRFSHLAWLRDDLLQCGYMGLFKACQTFNDAKGYQFSTYAARCIINAMLMFLRKENNHINNDTNFEINFEEGENVSVLNLLKTEIAPEHELDLLAFINKSKNKRILDLYIKGYTIKEISEELKMSRNCISRRLKKELYNYKQYINDKEF